MSADKPRYRRILLKLSGEALMGGNTLGIDSSILKSVSEEVFNIHKMGVETAIVIGGGNIFRGLNASEYGMGRVPADHMGMLATVINSLALGESLTSLGAQTRVMTAIDMTKVAEPYIRGRAVNHLKKGRIVILGAGTGNPYFSTDTAAALRAMEIDAEILLKATKVDGVYDSDPMKSPDSKMYEKLTYQTVLEKNLKVIDLTAISLAMSNNLPIIVFNLTDRGNINKVVLGDQIGTLISGEKT